MTISVTALALSLTIWLAVFSLLLVAGGSDDSSLATAAVVATVVVALVWCSFCWMPVWLDRHTTIEVETNEHIGELFKGAAGSFYWTLGKNLPSAIKRYRIITPNPTHWTIIDGVEVNRASS